MGTNKDVTSIEYTEKISTLEACLKHLETIRHACSDCGRECRILYGTMFGASQIEMLPKGLTAIWNSTNPIIARVSQAFSWQRCSVQRKRQRGSCAKESVKRWAKMTLIITTCSAVVFKEMRRILGAKKEQAQI